LPAMLPLKGDTQPIQFLATSAEELHGNFSPNGRYVAYTSNASGRFEIYVQSQISRKQREEREDDLAIDIVEQRHHPEQRDQRPGVAPPLPPRETGRRMDTPHSSICRCRSSACAAVRTAWG